MRPLQYILHHHNVRSEAYRKAVRTVTHHYFGPERRSSTPNQLTRRYYEERRNR